MTAITKLRELKFKLLSPSPHPFTALYYLLANLAGMLYAGIAEIIAKPEAYFAYFG